MKNFLFGIIFLAAMATLGCESNPTNEPAAADIEKAKVDRAAAIDNDPSLSPEGKAKMKEMLKLNGSGGPEESRK